MLDLSGFDRIRLAHLPTPVEPMARLAADLGGPNLLVKRDDCTGLATGGNKARKLEFLMAAAVREGADTVLTQGAVQSNHVRQTAAAACRLGLKCRVLLEERLSNPPSQYETSGNVWLNTLFGAEVAYRPGGSDMAAELDAEAEAVRSAGGVPYVIPGGGSNPLGGLGYVAMVEELAIQLRDQKLAVDHIVHATGSAGTQAGILAGLSALGMDIPVHGIGVRFDSETQESRVHALTDKITDLIGAPAVPRASVRAADGYIGDGYGHPTPGMVNAVRTTAQLEGLLLDPVYSGKGMAGLIDLVHKGVFSRKETVLFLHTGGAVGLFGYQWAFDDPPAGA